MKKTVSICLVALLLLNVMGYYGLFVGLKYKNALRVTSRIEADDYSESETITIKIPLAVPYYGDTDFERVDGEIEHQGQFYRLVKQKLEKDTLHVVCIRDTRAERIHEALTDYVNTFTDQSADRSNAKTIQSFIKDYFPSAFSLDVAAMGWTELLYCRNVDFAFSDAVEDPSSPPPRS
jgi:hypothetical protein